jgi:hypothetical protein
MPGTAPTQILLDDAVHIGRVATRKLERCRKGDLMAVMKPAGVVPESHVFQGNGAASAVVVEQLGRLEDFSNENRALAFRRR